jgi:hypothetical protein
MIFYPRCLTKIQEPTEISEVVAEDLSETAAKVAETVDLMEFLAVMAAVAEAETAQAEREEEETDSLDVTVQMEEEGVITEMEELAGSVANAVDAAAVEEVDSMAVTVAGSVEAMEEASGADSEVGSVVVVEGD